MLDNPYVSDNQLARAGFIAHAFTKLKRDIYRKRLTPLVVMGILPLCSAQYKRLYGTIRRPGHPCDQILHVAGPESDYCVCLRAGRWYKVPLASPHGRIYSPGEMEFLFGLVQRDVETEIREGEKVGPGEADLAALTSLGREEWAAVFEEHFTSGVNQVSMTTIEQVRAHACILYLPPP